MDRLLKIIESVKTLQTVQEPIAAFPASLTRKRDAAHLSRDRMVNLRVMVDILAQSSVKSHPDYSKTFSTAFELLFTCFNDVHADIRLVAEECTNTAIRTSVNDGNAGRVLVELYREIRRNGPPRSLKAALSRFSQLTHLIKPQKIRTYAVTMAQCIVQILKRSEDSVQDSINKFCPNILEVLAPFLSIQETKIVIKSALTNLKSESSTSRRASCTVLECICKYSRKSSLFASYVFKSVLDALTPVQVNPLSSNILGSLLCIRHILPLLSDSMDQGITMDIQSRLSVDSMVALYEVLLYHLYSNHSPIVAASLEALNQFHLHINCGAKLALTQGSGPGPSRLLNRCATSRTSSISGVSSLGGSRSDLASVHISQMNLQDEDEPLFPAPPQHAFQHQSETDEAVESEDEEEEDSSGSDTPNTQRSNILTPDPLTAISLQDDISICGEESSTPLLSPTQPLQMTLPENLGAFSDPCPAVNYCARVLVSKFLLHMNGLSLSDKQVRVSHKSLAMSALTSLLTFAPAVLKEKCFTSQDSSAPLVWQSINLFDHSDPKLRSCTVDLSAAIILATNLYSSDDVVGKAKDILVKSLKDKESSVIRESVVAIDRIYYHLLSSDPHFAISLLPIILSLSTDNYWLLKSAICQFISGIQFIQLRAAEIHILKSDTLMFSCVECIVDGLLLDKDPKVQETAAQTIVKLVCKLNYGPKPPLLSLYPQSIIYTLENESPWLQRGFPSVHNLNIPYSNTNDVQYSVEQINLSYMVQALIKNLTIKENTEAVLLGLMSLAEAFPPSMYSKCWLSNSIEDIGLVQLIMQLLNSQFASSLQLYEQCLCLIRLLIAGHISRDCAIPSRTRQEHWPVLGSNSLRSVSGEVLVLCLRILNVYWHVVTDTPPLVATSILSQAPNLSPVKHRINKTVGTEMTAATVTTGSKNKTLEFHSNFSCMKLHEILVKSYRNYKTSFDEASSCRFSGCLEKCMQCVCTLMEAAGQGDLGPYVDDCLVYLRTLMPIIPESSVICVTQMLKCLFGMNLVLTTGVGAVSFAPTLTSAVVEQSTLEYYIQHLSSLITKKVANAKNTYQTNGERIKKHLGWLGSRGDKHVLSLLKNTASKSALTSYIRLFEPIVVQSLRLYTSVTSTVLQKSVLNLLSQLVLVRVNYCLLDTDNRFLNFLFQQLETVEEGNFRDAPNLVCELFQLLVVLSYEKSNSSPIVEVGKILQQCDGLLASDRLEICYNCLLPVLHTVVLDLFCVRPNTKLESPEQLESQQEVVLRMLLRCVQHPIALEQLAVILYETRRVDIERWRNLSKTVAQKLVCNLENDDVFLNTWLDCETVINLINFMSPDTFAIPDELLKAFVKPIPLQCDIRWVLCRCVSLWALMTHCSENVLLSHIFTIASCLHSNSQDLESLLEALSGHLFSVLGCFSCSKLDTPHYMTASVFFALCINYIVSSGTYPRLSLAMCSCISTANFETITGITKATDIPPYLVMAWCCILANTKGFRIPIWSQLIASSKVVHSITLLLSCDYWIDLCASGAGRTVEDSILNSARAICMLQNETKVQKLIHSILKDQTLSASFLPVTCAMIDTSSQPKLVLCGLNLWSRCELIDVPLVLPALFLLLHSPFAIVRHKVALVLTVQLERIIENYSPEMAISFNPGLVMKFMAGFDHKTKNRFTKLYEVTCKLVKTLYPEQEISMETVLPLNGKFNRLKLVQLMQLGLEHNGLLPPSAFPPPLFECSEEEIEEVLCSQELGTDVLYSCLRYITERDVPLAPRSNESTPEHNPTPDMPPLYKPVKTSVFRRINAKLTMRIGGTSDPLLDMEGLLSSSHKNDDSGLVRCLGYIFSHDINIASEFEMAIRYLSYLMQKHREESIVHKFELLEAIRSVLCCPLALTEEQTTFQCIDQQLALCNRFFEFLSLGFKVSCLKTLAGDFDCSFELPENIDKEESLKFVSSWRRMAGMVSWLDMGMPEKSIQMYPPVVRQLIEDSIYALCRLPALNGLTRAPLSAFSYGWKPMARMHVHSGVGVLLLPAVPVHFLQNPGVLRQFVTRLCKAGWTNRQEFEELWMVLLGVLSATPVGQELNSNSPQTTSDRITSSALTVRCLSALLLQSLLTPQPGNPLSSVYILKQRETVHSPNLKQICSKIESCCKRLRGPRFSSNQMDDVLGMNLERIMNSSSFGFGQLSIETVWSVTGILAEERSLIKETSPLNTPPHILSVENLQNLDNKLDEQPFESKFRKSTSSFVLQSASALDLTSCLHFLQELYSHWLIQGCDGVPLPLLSATVESILMLSDLFTERGQYHWLRDSFRLVHADRASDDELLLQDLLLGLFKATAVLGIDESSEVQKEALIVLETGLNSPQLSVRLEILHGVLYLLQAVNHEEALPFIPPIVDFLLSELDSALVLTDSLLQGRPQSLDYFLTLWAVSFHLVQTQNDPYSRQSFVPKFSELCMRAFVSPCISAPAHRALTAGLQSLLLSVTNETKRNEISKLASACIYRPISPAHTVRALHLLLTCFLTNDGLSTSETTQNDPQLSAMELLTHLFSKISGGPELEACCVHILLPQFLEKNFSPGDVMNRVVSEMLAPTQARPKLLFSLIRKLFLSLQEREASSVVNDWALLSLPSFLYLPSQSSSCKFATCLLTCAANNQWIRQLFFLMIERTGPITEFDKSVLGLVVRNFQTQLQDTNQLESLNSILKKASKRHSIFNQFCVS